MLNPIQLRTLCAVVDTGSFVLAAQELGYTGSAVSQQISTLERRLGLALFERSARSVRPTSAALSIAARAQGILNALDVLQTEANGLARGSKGVLRVGSFPTFSAAILPRAVKHFRALRPQTEVWLEEGEPSVMIPRLISGELDIAIAYQYGDLAAEIPEDIATTPLLVEDLLLLQPGNTPAAGGLAEAHHSSFIATMKLTAGAACLESLCNEAGFSPQISLRINDYDVIQSFVAEGQGVAIVPALAYSPREGVLVRSVESPHAKRSVFAAHRAQSFQPLREPFLARLRDAVNPDSKWIHLPTSQ